jgi:hypothetical protein
MILPISFPDKKAAFVAAFTNRFDIGLVLGCVTRFPRGGVGGRAAIELARTLITKAYAPILIMGAIGGVMIGGVIHGRR